MSLIPEAYDPEGSAALQVGDNSTSDTHDVIRDCTEVVIPRSRRGPHFVVLQQVRIDEYTQLLRMTEGGHATFGFGILLGGVRFDPSALHFGDARRGVIDCPTDDYLW